MASMSKRAQARTERELQGLLQAPGNSACADCGARNPAWASWNLGVFLCMRCASIHRKLGTHISKVKSLSMDTWSNEQVDNMRKNGNIAVNKVYNPKNRRPDMPLDADEVDGAMERFIRKKYQEKSLSDGKPEVPSRDDYLPPRSRSPEVVPPPVLPSKKGRFFGFGLRSSSSAYPLSKHDKKHRNEPRVDSNYRISSEDYTSTNRASSSRAEMSDRDLQIKLAQLRDMGFTDNEKNTTTLKRHNGDVERTIASLVKSSANEQSTVRQTAPAPAINTGRSTPLASAQTSVSAPQSTTLSNNPFEQSMQPSSAGLTFGNSTTPATGYSTNPWQSAVSSQPVTAIEQSFSNMQVSQPLFPHSTGGYSSQPQYVSQTAQPPMPSMPQQYGMTSSPVNSYNPFMQTPLTAHSTGSNPYAAHMQSMPSFAPSTNPFLSAQNNSFNQQQASSVQGTNPFGLPPSNSPPQTRSQPIVAQPQPGIYDSQSMYSQAGPQSSVYGSTQYATQQQFAQPERQQSPAGLPNFQHAQVQNQQFQQQQQSPASPQSPFNPFLQQPQAAPQPQQYQQPQQQSQFNSYLQPQQQSQQQPQQPANPTPQFDAYTQQPQQQSPPPQQAPQQQQQYNQPLVPQQTGRFDKNSILALYKHPELAPPKPLASIPEPTEEQGQAQQNGTSQPQQITSPTPSGTIYGGANGIASTKRSATMPASSMHSAGGQGSRNPFMTSATSSAASTPAMPPQQIAMYQQGSRHASHDSMVVNNSRLEEGRHSPDAFANLSARYLR